MTADAAPATLRRRWRYPFTLAALAGCTLAVGVYSTLGERAAFDDGSAQAAAEPAPRAAEPAATHGRAAPMTTASAIDGGSELAVAEEAPAMAERKGARDARHADEDEAPWAGPSPDPVAVHGGYDPQLQARMLTAGRTSDLYDGSSIAELRSLALRTDPALAQAVPEQSRLGTPPRVGAAPRVLDVGLVLDTTGSMGDELAYLKVELRLIAEAIATDYPGVQQRYALVAYRDHGDDYLVRNHDFAPLDVFLQRLGRESAGGGGDTPEALDLALEASAQLSWSSGDAARMTFVVADAPPHAADYAHYVAATERLADRDVSVYPVGASGVGTVCEYLMRWAARTTGGQYIFLTDHSGIGNPHAAPHVQQYALKTLHDHMLEVIRLELGAQGDAPAATVDVRGGHDAGPSWWERHGALAFVLGGVFLLGFAGDMALAHSRRAQSA